MLIRFAEPVSLKPYYEEYQAEPRATMMKINNIVRDKIKEMMLGFDCCSEVVISREEYTPEFQVVFDREKLAMNGLNVSTAATYLRNRVNGAIASYYREDGEEYDILVRYAKEFRESKEALENVTIYSPTTGGAIKVRDLGEVIETVSPPSIERKDRSRYVKISAAIGHGYAMSDLIGGIKTELDKMDIPAGITWEFGGSYEDQQEMFGDLIMLLAMIIILVYIVMASQFESFMSPFVIMFSIPFAFVGVFMGLWVTGTPLGTMGMIGILILMGIVVKNGIVLIDYTILMRERGKSVAEASVIAAKSRLRPILMTTLTTVLGMVPMAIGQGEGSEMWRSLGMVVAWGLSISTLVTLVIIPTVYASMASWQERRAARKLAKQS